jgi:hypothetical protein
MLMTLNGRNKQDYIGGNKSKTTALLVLQIGIRPTHMNSWDLKKDYVSLH